MIYEAINKAVMLRVPGNARMILDIGCGSGAFGARLKSRQSCQITGITHAEDEAWQAREKIDKVLVGDLNTMNLSGLGLFDVIVCSHVLEHLFDPVVFLKKLYPLMKAHTVLLIALPNILFWRQRLKFMCGHFRYTQGGLMDETHFRFFDWNVADELPKKAGYQITEKVADGALPMPGLRAILPVSSAKALDILATRCFPGLFGWQFIMVCKKG